MLRNDEFPAPAPEPSGLGAPQKRHSQSQPHVPLDACLMFYASSMATLIVPEDAILSLDPTQCEARQVYKLMTGIIVPRRADSTFGGQPRPKEIPLTIGAAELQTGLEPLVLTALGWQNIHSIRGRTAILARS
jgi:hypothetical protein